MITDYCKLTFVPMRIAKVTTHEVALILPITTETLFF